MTLQVEILDPKAAKLLEDLADMNLIAIRNSKEESFMDVVHRIRAKAKNPPSLEEITEEVEIVRAERYARTKK